MAQGSKVTYRSGTGLKRKRECPFKDLVRPEVKRYLVGISLYAVLLDGNIPSTRGIHRHGVTRARAYKIYVLF